MRKIILLTVVWLTTVLFFQLKAQDLSQSYGKQYYEMGEFYRWGHNMERKPDKIKAIIAYQKSADLGYPDGIMAMGEMYQDGEGELKKDVNKGFELFTKAYELGSGRACYNLGKAYAYGLGCDVDYEKMIFYLNEGIKKGDPTSLYGMGNMLYKGWGVEQSYPKAIEYFEKAAALGSSSSNYYLGLCYRNGYGVPKDEQKGMEYLKKASIVSVFAQKELKKAVPEIDQAKLMENEEFESPQNFTKAKHNANINLFDGKWVGHITLYDWSGKSKIDEERIELDIKTDNDQFEGTGALKGEAITINGFNNQYGIVFNSGEFDFIDHFMDKVTLSIKTGSFELFKHGQTTILAGNISLFSISENAPERPAYLVLTRQDEEKEKNAEIPTVQVMNDQIQPKNDLTVVPPSEQVLAHDEAPGKIQSQDEIIVDRIKDNNINSRVWPIPFKNQLNVEYNLTTDCKIEIRLVSMDGKLMSVLSKEERKAGLQTQHFEVSVPKGSYVLQLVSGNLKASHIVINQ